MTTRRRFLSALYAGTLASPLALFAQQQSPRVRKVGYLGPSVADDEYSAFLGGLRELGYVEGKNVVLESRWAKGRFEQVPILLAELINLSLDVLVVSGTPATLAAKRATTTTPIVMAVAGGDPVATGLVASLAHPGGNVTGSTFFDAELSAKRLEILKEAIPHIRKVGLLLNPDNPAAVGPALQAMQAAAKSLKIALERFDVRAPDEFDAKFASMAKRSIQAVVVHEDSMLNANQKIVVAYARIRKLPAIGRRDFAEEGGLIGYGVDIPELFRRAAVFVDKILKGAKAADLPVERATRFELVINRKTAKAIGREIPRQLLLRADRVIE